MRKKITDQHGYTIGYEEDDGRITDTHGYTTGYVKDDGRITDTHGYTTGYRKKDGSDIRETDRYGNTIGYIKSDGRKTDRYGNTVGYSKDYNGGCYLTEACVSHKGMPDNCYELMMLRKFRDGYMQQDEERSQDVKSYYRLAPPIVEAIQAQTSSYQSIVYEKIYQVIQRCVAYIENNQPEKAYLEYKDMATGLSKRFNLGNNKDN